MAFGASLSVCHTVSNAVVQNCTACPNIPVVISLPLYLLNFQFPHVDGAAPDFSLLLHFQLTCHNLLKQLPIEAMDLKQPESQASQEPPAPSELPRRTSTPASSTTEVLSPEELELIKQHRASTKKSRMDQGWDELLSALAAKDVELSDLDFGLQQEPTTGTTSFTSGQSRFSCLRYHHTRCSPL